MSEINLLDDVRDVLTGWAPPSDDQAALRDGYLAHLRNHPAGLWRAGPPAHLTASCFVLDPLAEQVLMATYEPGDRILVDAGEDGNLTIAKAPPERKPVGAGSGRSKEKAAPTE